MLILTEKLKTMEQLDTPLNSWIKLSCNMSNFAMPSKPKSHHNSNELQWYKGKSLKLKFPTCTSCCATFLIFVVEFICLNKDGKLIVQDSRVSLRREISSFDDSYKYTELDLFAVNQEDSGVYQCKRDKAVLKNVFVKVSAENGNIHFKCHWKISSSQLS